MTVNKWVAASVGAAFALMLLALVFIAGRATNPAGSTYQPSTRHYGSYSKHYTHKHYTYKAKG